MTTRLHTTDLEVEIYVNTWSATFQDRICCKVQTLAIEENSVTFSLDSNIKQYPRVLGFRVIVKQKNSVAKFSQICLSTTSLNLP